MSQAQARDPIVLWSVPSVALGKEAQDAVTPGLQLIVSARALCRTLTTDHQCQIPLQDAATSHCTAPKGSWPTSQPVSHVVLVSQVKCTVINLHPDPPGPPYWSVNTHPWPSIGTAPSPQLCGYSHTGRRQCSLPRTGPWLKQTSPHTPNPYPHRGHFDSKFFCPGKDLINILVHQHNGDCSG